MKKSLFGAIFFLCLCLAAAAQNIPDFTGEGADKAVLIDIKSHKGAKDNIVLVNHALSADGRLNAKIYVYDKKDGWIEFGYSSLRFFGDLSKVEASKTKNFGRYPYAAIVFDSKEKFSCKSKVDNSDLYLYIQPEDSSYSSMKGSLVELDVSKIKGKFRDNIRLIGSSEKFSQVGFLVFGDKGDGMEPIGSAYLKSGGDTCFVRMIDSSVSLKKYSGFSVLAMNGKKFTPKLSALNNDLYIYVSD